MWEHPLFAVLSPTQRQWISARIFLEETPARATIYEAGERPKHFYFILSGKIKVESISESGSHLIKKIGHSQGCFGLKSLFGDSPIGEFARTLRSAASLVKFNNRDLCRLAEVNHEFARHLMRLAWEEITHLEKRTRVLTELSARQRFAHFLVEMTKKEGEFDGQYWLFNSQMTQAEIGAYIGTGRQTVTEILNEFRDQGTLRYSWGRFFIHDLKRLEQFDSL